jgi:hypothetical protein
MIRPNVRASFGRREAELLLALVGPSGEQRLRNQGLDALLDDTRVLRGLVRSEQLITTAPAPLVFYVLVRHALLQREIEDRQLADYTAALLLEFGTAGRVHHAEGVEEPLRYLVDILEAIQDARGEREFHLRVHLGNHALWLAGLFPDWITTRVQRRGAPPLSYYDAMGSAGFRMAAGSDLALRYGVGDLFVTAADRFSDVRAALNSLSDTLFFPHTREAVERLLRQVSDDFHHRHGG